MPNHAAGQIRDTRTETDSFGPIEIPSDRYWGAQTQRSLANFPIGWERQPVSLIRALGIIKKACAEENVERKLIDPEIGSAIVQAAEEVAGGSLDDHFPSSSGKRGPEHRRT